MNVVFRADDAGSTEGANWAIVETVRDGVVRNVSVMVPGPAFDHAVPLLQCLDDVALGLHVTLNSEWDDLKWGPVLPADQVPSLGVDGAFTQFPAVLKERGFSIGEAMAEVAAQLEKARRAGLKIEYLDQHMGVGWLPGLGERLIDFAAREGLTFARVPFFQGTLPAAGSEAVHAILHQAEPVTIVFHPGSDDDETMASFIHDGLKPGQILAERAADRRFATHPELVRAVRDGRIRSCTYPEVSKR